MRNLISGIVGLTLGSFCLITNLIRGGPQGEGGYFAGQVCALLTGVLLFIGGIAYLVLGVLNLQSAAKKKKRRARREEDDDWDDRPRRKRRSRDEDDDEDDRRDRPRKKRRSRADDNDED